MEFAQPRNLLGGHILSALIDVTLRKFLPLDVALLVNNLSANPKRHYPKYWV